MRFLTQFCRQMQLVVKLQPVVNVLRFTADVFVGALVFATAPHAARQRLTETFGQLLLGIFGAFAITHKPSPRSPAVAQSAQ
ncbi:hypothetical protein D3C73_1477690 [compost metagenome]